MSLDFNDAPKQQSFEIIPAGTIAPVAMKVRPGGTGEGGWLKDSKSSDAQMLDCEFVVTEGEYANRKFWSYFVLFGGKLNERGESIGGNISRGQLRAILESARGINPTDESPQARSARAINSWDDMNGMVFLCRIGIQKDKTGQYDDKNVIKAVITPDMGEYKGGGSTPAPAQAPAPAPAPAPAFAPPPPQQKPQSNPVPAWAR